MKLQEMIQMCHFEVFYHELLKFYDDMSEDDLELIKRGYKELKTLEINDIEEPLEILVTKVVENKEITYDIAGIKEGDEVFYSLLFMDWKDLLAFNVHEDNFKEFGPETVLAHIYWEMTWTGFTYNETKENQLDSEVESEFRKTILKLIEGLKDQESISREDIERYIETYNQSRSEETKIAIGSALEDLIVSQKFSRKVLEYIMEEMNENEFNSVNKDNPKYES